MTAPGIIDARKIGLHLGTSGVTSCEIAAVLESSDLPGFTSLRIGPVGTPEFPEIDGSAIELDADACRHLARLLDAKADELSHPSSAREASE